MSNYKLAIAAFVLVPMSFTLANGDQQTKFDFKLQAQRLSQDEWKQRFQDDAAAPTTDKLRDVMLDITNGWRDQTLVLDDAAQPAAFCREALEVMFQTPGVFDLYVAAYLQEVKAKVKN